jgi:hypothetical protein
MNKNPTIVLENQNLETYTKNQANSLYAQVRRQYGYIKPFARTRSRTSLSPRRRSSCAKSASTSAPA